MKKPLIFKPHEKFLVLEIMPSGVNGLFLSVDEDRNLIFEKFVRNIDLKKFFRSPVRRATQQSWEGNYLFKGHRKVIAVADSSLATTIPIPVDLVREPADAHIEISVPELENLIAQEMAKIFNQCRSEAAERLGIHELDAMLVGEKAKYFKVDGEEVVNPVGFAGKKISLLLDLTFTTRGIFETLQQFFNAPEDFFFAESAQVRLTSIARARKLPLNLVFSDHGTTSLFILERTKAGHPILYREPFTWSFDTLFGRVAGEFGVSDAAAREMYGHYVKKGVSESAARAFKKTIDPAVDELLREVEKKKLKGFLYMDAPHALPFDMPYRHEGVVFEELPLAEVLQGLGFGAGMQGGTLSAHELSRHLLPFLEAYFDKSDMEINQKLRRRLHWLAV
ncbi:MAG: hypothetical protein P4L67_03940 [Candidatus Pacebacteria bacterium]|nr:hypothetical protein [Candidatus Paceibacterota bacterium]